MDFSTIYGFGIFGIIALIFSIIAIITATMIIYKLSIFHALRFIFRYIETSIVGLFNNNDSISSEVCSLIPGSSMVGRVPSLYIGHIAFFVGFLLMNASLVYTMPQDQNLPQNNYNNRRNRALMTMILLSVLYIALVIFRYTTSSCDSLLGLIFTTTAFTSIGAGWYKFAETCGVRTADILGIAPSIVSKSATPMVCASAPSTPPPSS